MVEGVVFRMGCLEEESYASERPRLLELDMREACFRQPVSVSTLSHRDEVQTHGPWLTFAWTGSSIRVAQHDHKAKSVRACIRLENSTHACITVP